MMANLFSSFDPCASSHFFINWLSILAMFLLTPSSVWFLKSRMTNVFYTVTNTLHEEFKMLLSEASRGSTLIFTSMLLIIATNNFMGLFPYIFTSSSHLIMALTLAAPLWLSFMLYGWVNNMKHMFAHLVPLSTPNLLMPFMVLIETISNVIRPGTLTVRLSANMIAGHLLLTLLGNQAASSNSFILILVLIAQTLLLLLEMAVALIQSYVFTVLSTLYSSEVQAH